MLYQTCKNKEQNLSLKLHTHTNSKTQSFVHGRWCLPLAGAADDKTLAGAIPNLQPVPVQRTQFIKKIPHSRSAFN